MIELLTQLGLPVLVVLALAVTGIVLREAFSMLKARRLSLADEVARRQLNYLDSCISKFYLPLVQRFHLSRRLFTVSKNFQEQGHYKNESASIDSDNPNALRDIFVRKIFMPINKDIQTLISTNGHLRHPDDNCDYDALISHYTLWTAFEEALVDGDIRFYNVTTALGFPVKEIEKVETILENLLQERTECYKLITNLRSPNRVMAGIHKKSYGRHS